MGLNIHSNHTIENEERKKESPTLEIEKKGH